MNKTGFKKAVSCYLLILISLALFACGGEEPSEPEENTEPQAETAPDETPTESPGQTEQYDNYDVVGGIADLPKITSVSIETVSSNIRDGFRALAETEDNNSEDTDLIYQWKHNGNALTGETGSVIEWQNEFKRGDSLSVAVVPVNTYGEGVWAAEGGIVIPNSPPVIISEPSSNFDSGSFSYTVEAQDPDGDSFDYTLRGAPRGMTIEPATGLITWEYSSEDAGDYQVLIIVTDSEGAETSQTLTFTIHGEGS